MRVTFALLTAFAVAASAGPCRSRMSSSTLATTASTEVSEPTATSSETSAIVSSIATTFTSTVEPAETSISTTITEMSTTLAIPEPTQTLFNFCIKAATPDVANYGQLIHVQHPDTLMMTKPNSPTYQFPVGRFNLDTSTGALTVNNTAYPGYQVHMHHTSNGSINPMRFSTAPAANPLLCFNPDGQYASGSVLKCSATEQWGAGLRTYRAFSANRVMVAAISPWQIVREGFQIGSTWVEYDVAMYFGDDCP